MTLDEYQKTAMTFASYGQNPFYPMLGLSEECGELIALMTTKNDTKEKVIGEIGDIVWMIAGIAKENKTAMGELEIFEIPTLVKSGKFRVMMDILPFVCGLHGKTAKFVRKHEGFSPTKASRWISMENDVSEYKVTLRGILSEILSRVVMIARKYGLTLEEVLDYNIAKLTERKQAGVIIGNGDTTEERIANAAKEKESK